MDRTKLIKDIDPAAENLEGYLYPSTYQFPEDADAEAIVTKMVQQFKQVWQPEWDDSAIAIKEPKGKSWLSPVSLKMNPKSIMKAPW